ncbi:MAG TPA: Fic family protein, partial [Burkholderiales bacterium]|nr:Fic family protein [Burkholderiales bacterium]
MAGYAEVMELAFSSWQDIAFTKNTSGSCTATSSSTARKDAWQRGNYKTSPNSVAAFDEEGQQVGVV